MTQRQKWREGRLDKISCKCRLEKEKAQRQATRKDTKAG